MKRKSRRGAANIGVPYRHPDHPRPVTRRQFVAQGFVAGAATVIAPTLFVAIALRTIWALKSFDLIYTLTAGGPSNGTNVIGYYTYLQSFVSLDLGRGAATAYLLTFAIMGLVLLYHRLLYREVRY